MEEFKRDPTEDDIIENFENDKENDIDEDLLIEFFRTENKNKGEINRENIKLTFFITVKIQYL